MYCLKTGNNKTQGEVSNNFFDQTVPFVQSNPWSNTVFPRSIVPRFIVNLAYRQNSCLSRFPPLKIPRYTAKLSYCHLPQVFKYKNRKTNLNSPVSTAHNYLLTAVYWSVIMECQDWSSDWYWLIKYKTIICCWLKIYIH
jgi:hypothetical protein